MWHFNDRMRERAPHICRDVAARDIRKWKKQGGQHARFDLVGQTANGADVYRYTQGRRWTYFVLDPVNKTFCTVYTQEFVSSMKRAAKKRKRRRSIL